MKPILTILCVILTATAFAQKKQTVELKWKIGKNEKLNYLTVMSDLDTSHMEMNFGGLFNALSDTSDNGLKKSKRFFENINRSFQNQDFLTTLTNKGNGVINILTTTKPKEYPSDTTNDKEADFLKMMQAMNQGVYLRGSVYENGGVHSFWVKSAQKNIIALLFELPTQPVKVGSKWSLDISLIANDQNFDCDTAHKVNEVTLVDLKTIKGETIAVLKYTISEYVKGSFHTPSFFGNEGGKKETTMSFVHQGVAEFSVDKGRWISYDGIMSTQTTGVMIVDKKTKFTLIDAKNAGR